MGREASSRGQGTCHGGVLLPFVMVAIDEAPCGGKGVGDRQAGDYRDLMLRYAVAAP